MGRLSKARIDQIARLRNKGYLQKEVAQRVGVNIKTVRAYDPLARPAKREAEDVEKLDAMSAVEIHRDLGVLAKWLVIMSLSLPEEIPCPICLYPSFLEPKMKSRTVILKMLDDGDYKCPECGTVLTSPLRLAWRLSVAQVIEEGRREKSGSGKGENAS